MTRLQTSESAGARRIRPTRVPVLLLLLAALVGRPERSAAQAPPDTASLALHFLDVGQGDAILIRLGRRGVLVDASRGDDIVLVLAPYRVDSLIALIASHNHDDHIGGMDAVIADYPVGRYFGNGRPPETAAARNVELWLAVKHVARGRPGDPITLGDAKLTVFRTLLDSAQADENNSSLGVLVERGAFRALLTGDSERPEIGAWVAAGAVPDVDVLKAAHHGALNGVTAGWLDRARPEVVVISLGAGNPYGHPDPLALRYYGTHGRRVFRTDRDGTVTVWVDPAGRYRVEPSGPTPR